MGNNDALRVLIVDDTIVYRNVLKVALSEIKNTEIVGVAPNGLIALEKIKMLAPDLILLDVEMPQMDGLTALAKIKEQYDNIGVIMVSGTNRNSTDNTIKALELGALDFVKKPEEKDISANIQFIREILTPIINTIYMTRPTSVVPKKQPPKVAKRTKIGLINETSLFPHFDILAIGSSTGGPNALMKLLPKLPKDFPVPVVLVQHMPKGFSTSLSHSLNAKSKLNIIEARGGETIKPGYVYIAPGGKHLLIKTSGKGLDKKYSTVVSDGAPENNCKPSFDVLLKSLRRNFTGNVMITILTGMGADGLNGVRSLKKRGNCYCVTQDEDSCVVYGMPRAVAEEGLSDLSSPLSEIADNITHLIGKKDGVNIN